MDILQMIVKSNGKNYIFSNGKNYIFKLDLLGEKTYTISAR